MSMKSTSKGELLFTVTKDDCDFEYIRGTGPGGQARNKTSSKVRCTHRESGAVGISDETRSQHDNKKKAFLAMSQTKEFKSWHKTEVARRLGIAAEIEETVNRQMKQIRVEGKDENGRWTEI